jgi:hypothetical protein
MPRNNQGYNKEVFAALDWILARPSIVGNGEKVFGYSQCCVGHDPLVPKQLELIYEIGQITDLAQ